MAARQSIHDIEDKTMGTIKTLPAKRPDSAEVINRRILAYQAACVARNSGMSTKWVGHWVFGFDKAKNEWVPL